MKKIILVSFLFVMLFSCKKKEEFPANPDWLNTKISQMETTSFPGSTIYAYKWNNAYYYHIQSSVSSCGYCEFYNYDGEKYVFTAETFEDFMNNGEKLQLVWEKPF